MTRTNHPLQWPHGWPRTHPTSRSTPRFESYFGFDREAVIWRIERRNGSHIAVTSELSLDLGCTTPQRLQDLVESATYADPGVAVWWIEHAKNENVERVLACDKWLKLSDNLCAIRKTLDALAGIERWGASQVLDKAFAGFTALPSGDAEASSKSSRPWREVLGGEWPMMGDAFPPLVGEQLFAIAKKRYRLAMGHLHPDKGGDNDRAVELNQAIEDAESELIYHRRMHP